MPITVHCQKVLTPLRDLMVHVRHVFSILVSTQRITTVLAIVASYGDGSYVYTVQPVTCVRMLIAQVSRYFSSQRIIRSLSFDVGTVCSCPGD